jgi:hypothetical protein
MEEESLSKESNSLNIYGVIIFVFINYYYWLFLYYKLCNEYNYWKWNMCTKFVNGFNNIFAFILPQMLISTLIIYFGSNYLGWISIILCLPLIISIIYDFTNMLRFPGMHIAQIFHLVLYFEKLFN